MAGGAGLTDPVQQGTPASSAVADSVGIVRTAGEVAGVGNVLGIARARVDVAPLLAAPRLAVQGAVVPDARRGVEGRGLRGLGAGVGPTCRVVWRGASPPATSPLSVSKLKGWLSLSSTSENNFDYDERRKLRKAFACLPFALHSSLRSPCAPCGSPCACRDPGSSCAAHSVP